MRTLEGAYTPPVGGRVALVAARFNAMVVDRLIEGATDALTRHGIEPNALTLVRVPGSFEIPGVVGQLVHSGQYTAIICLGCVIRGETDHYDYVANAATNGIARLAADSKIPVIFGVLTCDTLEQAINRAGAKSGNKGFDAGLTALEMMHLYRQLSPQTE